MTEERFPSGGGIRSEQHKVRIGDTNHQRFVDRFDHALLADIQGLRAADQPLAVIARLTGKSTMTVSRWLRHGCDGRQNTITTHPRSEGPVMSSHGYVLVTVGGVRMYEHQAVAERALGRKLARHEIVHHVNCIKSDNRPANLLICTHAYHMALHARMRKHPFWSQFPITTTEGSP